MTKKGYKKIPIDVETYALLKKEADNQGLTVDEYTTQLLTPLFETPIDKAMKILKP